jgi:rRNA-processing protein FCF1
VKFIPQKVVLDTNALLMIFQFKINIEGELERLLGNFEILIPSAVITELNCICSQEARAALSLSARYTEVESHGMGDDAILATAVAMTAVLVTNDKPLIKRAKNSGLGIIRLRQKKYLVLE